MQPNRHVPLIFGVVLTAAGIVVAVSGEFSFWRGLVAAALLAFGIPSLRTAFAATDREIAELTGEAPLSDYIRFSSSPPRKRRFRATRCSKGPGSRLRGNDAWAGAANSFTSSEPAAGGQSGTPQCREVY